MNSSIRSVVRSGRAFCSLLAALIAVQLSPATARAAPADAPTACAAIAGAGNTSISGARQVRVAEREVCVVTGRGAAAGEFTLQLPIAEWNGKFAQLSCSGDCADSSAAICDNVVRRGFACLAAGREKKPVASADGSHALALLAKEVIARFYGKPAATNLFLGCGEGGHDALVEAQRYPQDFNAIVASAPVIDPAAYAADLRWRLATLRGAAGRPKLTQQDLQQLHAAAVAKCDAADGLRDGLIGQPLRCGFDPQSIVCGSAPAGACLSPAAVAVAVQLYAGPPVSNDAPRATAGLLPGSELEWAALLKPGAELQRRIAAGSKTGGAQGAAPDAAALELSAFIAARGKLMLVQGLADPFVSPRRTLRSYESLVSAAGGLVKTQGSVRLYAVPNLAHCGGGEGANRINLLSVIETWASGRAPDDFIAFRALDAAVAAHPFAPAALDGAQSVYGGWMLGNPVSLEQARELSGTALSRPVFLYPYRTQYKGRGDPRLWMSFFAPGDFTLLSN